MIPFNPKIIQVFYCLFWTSDGKTTASNEQFLLYGHVSAQFKNKWVTTGVTEKEGGRVGGGRGRKRTVRMAKQAIESFLRSLTFLAPRDSVSV